MNRLISTILFGFFIPFVSAAAFAAQAPNEVTRREFSEALNEKYKGGSFDYSESDSEFGNILVRALAWLLRKIGTTFGFSIDPNTILILEKLIFAVIIAIVIYILITFLAGKGVFSLLTPKSKTISGPDYEVEDIKQIDFDTLIVKALENSNYRLAIRYMYLKSLKILSAKKHIDWNVQKTNSDYTSEINNPQLKTLFRKVSVWYDHIWYGEYALDAGNFEIAEKDFNNLNREASV